MLFHVFILIIDVTGSKIFCKGLKVSKTYRDFLCLPVQPIGRLAGSQGITLRSNKSAFRKGGKRGIC